MSSEKVSNTQKVLEALNKNTPYRELDVATGLEWSVAFRALQNLRRTGRVPRPTKEEQYKHVSDSLSGRLRVDLSEVQTSTWKTVYPLALRNGLIIEITEITGFTYHAVNSLINRPPRNFMDLPEYKLPESQEGRRLRANRRISDAKRGIRPSPEQMNALAFASSLFRAGFISEDLRYWQQLHDIFQGDERLKKEHIAYALTLEAFLVARQGASNGDRSLLDTYAALGKEIDGGWFASEPLTIDRKKIMAACQG